MEYKHYTLDKRPELIAQLPRLDASAWPRFMREDPIADQYWSHLYSDFAAYQVAFCNANDEVIAAGYTIPFVWDGSLQGLPAGWDAVLAQGVTDHQQGRRPNTLSALAATIDPAYQGGGLSSVLIKEMKAIAIAHRLRAFIAPVRPSQKSHYPFMPMEQYASWTRPDGLPVDPWLRVHARLGASMLKIAPESMRIEGSIADWEEWAARPFNTSGPHAIAGALVPVQIDCSIDRGSYVEPNVWMQHPLQ